MTIDVYFYTKLELDILNERVSELEAKYPVILERDYGIVNVRMATETDQEILEYESGLTFEVKTIFIARLWNTDTEFLTQDLAALVKNEFAPDPVIALFEAETLL